MLIIFIYIVVFWFLLPAVLVFASITVDEYMSITLPESSLLMIFGIIIALLAASMLTTAILQFRRFGKKLPIAATPPDVLINRGMFTVWRHPIYLSYTLLFLGIALIIGSAGMLYIILPVFIVGEYIYIQIEEHYLIKRLGNYYTHYRKTTSLILPRLPQLLRIPLRILFKLLFSYKVVNKMNIPQQPPFFIVASHRNYLDPFFIALPIPFPVHYITTFEMYRKPALRFLFSKLFCIPKKRYLNDSRALRNIISKLDGGGIIGIFPEGERSWTENISPFKPEVIKLLKKFRRIPIVPVRIDGNYLAWPRWGALFRRAQVSVTFQKPYVITTGESMEQIEENLRTLVQPADGRMSCTSKRVVNDIKKVIYRCPVCLLFDQMEIRNKSQLCCNACQRLFSVLNNYQIRYLVDGKEVRQTLHELYEKIKVKPQDIIHGSHLKSMPLHKSATGERILHFTERTSVFAEHKSKMRKILYGRCLLTEHYLRFSENDKNFELKLNHIRSLTAEGSKKLQLYDRSRAALFQLIFESDSILKWQDFIYTAIRVTYNYSPIRQ